MGGIVEGVEMASRSYLGKSAQTLSSAEAALLVVLPQAPSLYDLIVIPNWHKWRAIKFAPHGGTETLDQAEVDDALIERVGANPPAPIGSPLAAERLQSGSSSNARIAW